MGQNNLVESPFLLGSHFLPDNFRIISSKRVMTFEALGRFTGSSSIH